MKYALMVAGLVVAATRCTSAEMPLALDAVHSRVEVMVKATVDSFTGKLERYHAEVAVDPQAAVPVTRAKIAFKFADVKTGKTDRDEQMLIWGEESSKPDGSFTLAALTPIPAGGYQATGTLVFHGMAHELSFPVRISHEGEVYAVDGDATLDTRDFGLPVIRKFMMLKVDPVVHVRFHLQGHLAAAKLS